MRPPDAATARAARTARATRVARTAKRQQQPAEPQPPQKPAGWQLALWGEPPAKRVPKAAPTARNAASAPTGPATGIRANDGRVYVTYLGKKVALVSLCELWELEGAKLQDEDRTPANLVRNLRPPQPPDPLRELLVGVCAGCGWQAIALHECIVHYPDLGNLRRREYWCPHGHDIYAEDLFIPPIVCTWPEAERPAREAYLKGITEQEHAWRQRTDLAAEGDTMDGVYPCPSTPSHMKLGLPPFR